MLRVLILLLTLVSLIAEEDPSPSTTDSSNPTAPEMVEPITVDDPTPQQDALSTNPDPVTAPGEIPGAPVPEENMEPVDPLADFQRPDYITIQYVYEIYDILTGDFIKEDYSNELDTQKTDDYEKIHGPLTRAQWIEIKEMGLLKIYVNFYDGFI